MYGKVYTFHSFFSSQIYTHHLWSFKLEHYLCFDANSHILEFCWLATWLRCVEYMWGWAFHMYCMAKCIILYTFHSLLALNSTHIICEASNLNTTFVLMLIVIFLSFVDWRRGWGVFSTCEDELFTCTVWQSAHVSQLFSSQFYTHHLWSFKLEYYLCFDANSHIVEFRCLAIDVVEVRSIHVRMSFSHVHQSVHISQLFSSQFYTHHTLGKATKK